MRTIKTLPTVVWSMLTGKENRKYIRWSWRTQLQMMGCESTMELTAGKTCLGIPMVTSKLYGPGHFPASGSKMRLATSWLYFRTKEVCVCYTIPIPGHDLFQKKTQAFGCWMNRGTPKNLGKARHRHPQSVNTGRNGGCVTWRNIKKRSRKWMAGWYFALAPYVTAELHANQMMVQIWV